MKILKTSIDALDEKVIGEAIEVLSNGGVVLYPTDTVWGIGCDATNADAVAKIYQLKQRCDSKALIILLGSDNQLHQYVEEKTNH